MDLFVGFFFNFLQDSSDPALLLSKDNIDRKALERYATEAATYSTEGALGTLPFEKNHRGENDVALFDFTSLFAAQNAARIVERKGKKILLCLVGDSLLEVCMYVQYMCVCTNVRRVIVGLINEDNLVLLGGNILAFHSYIE